jgi:hypothetical protein
MSRKDNMGAADNVSMDYGLYKVHDGGMYHIVCTNSLAAAANLDMMFYHSTASLHIDLEVGCGGAVTARLLEGITSSANGTTLTAYNMNRNSTNSTGAYFWQAPTWSTASEKTLVNKYIGATSGEKIGMGVRKDVSWDLIANTKYLLRITNSSGATITASINGEFYEV